MQRKFEMQASDKENLIRATDESKAESFGCRSWPAATQASTLSLLKKIITAPVFFYPNNKSSVQYDHSRVVC
jgi:hypothetical protein